MVVKTVVSGAAAYMVPGTAFPVRTRVLNPEPVTFKPQTLNSNLAAAQLDVDGDGFLSAEELQRGLRDCDIFANVEDICQLMEENVSDSGVHEKHLISAQNFHVRHVNQALRSCVSTA